MWIDSDLDVLQAVFHDDHDDVGGGGNSCNSNSYYNNLLILFEFIDFFGFLI